MATRKNQTVPLKNLVLVIWDDYTGLPRAWASGPRSTLESVRKLAREHLQTYCREKAGTEPDLADPENFKERIVDLDGAGKS